MNEYPITSPDREPLTILELQDRFRRHNYYLDGETGYLFCDYWNDEQRNDPVNKIGNVVDGHFVPAGHAHSLANAKMISEILSQTRVQDCAEMRQRCIETHGILIGMCMGRKDVKGKNVELKLRFGSSDIYVGDNEYPNESVYVQILQDRINYMRIGQCVVDGIEERGIRLVHPHKDIWRRQRREFDEWRGTVGANEADIIGNSIGMLVKRALFPDHETVLDPGHLPYAEISELASHQRYIHIMEFITNFLRKIILEEARAARGLTESTGLGTSL